MDVETFLRRWQGKGSSERSNAHLFLTDLCDLLDVPRPDVAMRGSADDYVFERPVRSCLVDGPPMRIDLYRRGSFILEAKQSRRSRAETAEPLTDDPVWDRLMRAARKQAFGYVQHLPPDHRSPPFLLICDIGRAIEVHADFSGTGRGYGFFPDAKRYRIALADLREPAVRDRLRAIWLYPLSLDPARHRAAVTEDIMADLSRIAARLDPHYGAEVAASFLMRVIFTLFASSVGLISRDHVLRTLDDAIASPSGLAEMFSELWKAFDQENRELRFAAMLGGRAPFMGGGLFADSRFLSLTSDEIAHLANAARRDWRNVEPAIFGTLLENALSRADRARLGAHYTPRAHVERLVELTVMEPLREDWRRVETGAEFLRDQGRRDEAIAEVRAFHRKLADTRVLDPACGGGAFLYIALDMMGSLEDAVLNMLLELGDTARLGLDGVQPSRFLGLEVSERAAPIARLVLWIGFLQRHYSRHREPPSEPILKSPPGIERRDALLTWTGAPLLKFDVSDSGGRQVWPNAARASWPAAEFIVGNPPFIGGKDLKRRLDPGYAEVLRRAHPHINDSADLCMYWWDHAAELLTREGTVLRRFGFITTNSITQPFQRRVVERHLSGGRPVSLTAAIPDHPWYDAPGAAAVRVAMTVAEAGVRDGLLFETPPDDASVTRPVARYGRINADLTLGVDRTRVEALVANEGLCSPGMKLHGAGFIITPEQARALGLGVTPGLERHIRPYRNGRDLMGRPRDLMVIDLHGLDLDTVRRRFPTVYQHVVAEVKELKTEDGVPVGRDVNPRALYRDRWWLFGEPRVELRHALKGKGRYIATAETAKHRTFQFLDIDVTPDNMLVVIASDDAAMLAMLSSRFHCAWARAQGGVLEDRPRYTKSLCFDPFPFPDLSSHATDRLRTLGEELDAHRKRVLEADPDLTMTDLYNALGQLQADAVLGPTARAMVGRTLSHVLRDIHAAIDEAVALAYGWPVDLRADKAIERLVRLNAQRRTDQPIQPTLNGLEPKVVASHARLKGFPKAPREQPIEVQRVIREAGRPIEPADIARAFRRHGASLELQIDAVLHSLERHGHVERLDDGRFRPI